MYMGFYESRDNIYSKHYVDFDCFIDVNFIEQSIIYPQDKGLRVNDATTSNFDHPENFVVLECVNRLLDKGYRPEHIELEKRWTLGHNPVGGKADICVYDSNGENVLLIIECKTPGKEYKGALKKLKEDGGQLFSYWQQEQSTKWLCLYTSDFDFQITINVKVIACQDDNNIKELAKKDGSIKLYTKAHSVEELFDVWEETYGKALWDDIIFHPDSTAYSIGVRPLRKKDLKDFTTEDKIVNRFEEILRHNNVSDKENAFNRLVALFICKLVDEIRKSDDDVVEFQYKQGTDTYETLQDRLQRLHRDGMQDFMKEEIFYVSSEYPAWLFSNYTGQQRKYAIEDLKRTLKILKFYTNNDFSFKDVHNEELFLQNGKILVEMVQLFQNYRIVYPNKQQFLGDLFEQLLNKGFKQNEGQFFTPTPITRFIWDCLPLHSMINDLGHRLPRIIDYACGAGHFLTEGVEAVNHYTSQEDNSWVRDSIFGIEKDYRLARVAKISMFMNGAGESNIIFGDGLDNAPEKGVSNGTFDILVANPPYSVSGFKTHLKLKNNSLELLSLISFDGSEIETAFVERIAQLVKPKGIAAVVLPVGLFTNVSKSENACREIILENFEIISIVRLPGNTFGETGQNTNILFLRKYNEPPKKSDIIMDTVNAIMDNPLELSDWNDSEVFENYLTEINLSALDYVYLLSGSALSESTSNQYINNYIEAFNKLVSTKTMKQKASFKKLPYRDQVLELAKAFSAYVKSVEIDKIKFFALTYCHQTCIITIPEETKKRQLFLGYKWSKRGGQEGIDIINYGGQLFNPENREDRTLISGAIKNTFLGEEWSGLEEISQYVKFVATSKLLDFQRPSFHKPMSLSFRKNLTIASQYPLYPLGKVCDIIIGGTPSRKIHKYFQGNNLWVSIGEMNGQIINDTKEKITDEAIASSNVKLIKKGSFLLSFKLSIGKTAIAGADLYTNEAIAAIIPRVPSELASKFLFYLFKAKVIDLKNVDSKSFGKSVNTTFLKNEVLIPVPPIDVQKRIIKECEAIDDRYNSIRMSIEEYENQIKALFNRLKVAQSGGVYLTNKQHFSLMIGKRVVSKELSASGSIPVYSANVYTPFGYMNHSILNDFSKPSILWGIDGDWMVNYIPQSIKFNPTDHCGVLRVESTDFNPRYVAHALKEIGSELGFSRAFRASIERIESISIPLVPINLQNEIMYQIETLETEIAKSKATLQKLETDQLNLVTSLL